MALIYCPECGHEISSAAVACPQCGRPVNATPPAASRVIVTDPVERDGVPPWAIAAMALAGVFVVFGLIWLLSNRNDDSANLSVNVNAQRRAAANSRDVAYDEPSRTVDVPSSTVGSTTVPSTSSGSSYPSEGSVTTVPGAPVTAAPAIPDKGTVNISASISTRNGGKQAVRGTKFYLLDEDIESILSNADLEPIAGQSLSVSFAMAMADQSTHADFYRKAMAALRDHIKYAGTTDANGKAQLGSVKPDSYYLFGFTKSGNSFAMWNSTVSVIGGDNNINLAPQTLTEMPRMTGYSEFNPNQFNEEE
jgi:zinc-ribbon domain